MTDRLTYEAQKALIAGQAQLDRDAGIDWSVLHQPLTRLDDMLRRAHHAVPLDLDDPQVWMYNEDRRRAGARKLRVSDHQADDLSRWALATPDEFDPADLRCWRIGSPTWLELANDVLAAVEHVDRPVAAFVVPEIRTTRARTRV